MKTLILFLLLSITTIQAYAAPKPMACMRMDLTEAMLLIDSTFDLLEAEGEDVIDYEVTNTDHGYVIVIITTNAHIPMWVVLSLNHKVETTCLNR